MGNSLLSASTRRALTPYAGFEEATASPERDPLGPEDFQIASHYLNMCPQELSGLTADVTGLATDIYSILSLHRLLQMPKGEEMSSAEGTIPELLEKKIASAHTIMGSPDAQPTY